MHIKDLTPGIPFFLFGELDFEEEVDEEVDLELDLEPEEEEEEEEELELDLDLGRLFGFLFCFWFGFLFCLLDLRHLPVLELYTLSHGIGLPRILDPTAPRFNTHLPVAGLTRESHVFLGIGGFYIHTHFYHDKIIAEEKIWKRIRNMTFRNYSHLSTFIKNTSVFSTCDDACAGNIPLLDTWSNVHSSRALFGF